jgi:uncharacterized tellurite resistance protein B-like protein
MERKLNKPIAGFHLLMLITHADGKFAKEEGDVIVQYLSEFFPFQVSLDDEVEFLATLSREKYMDHFCKAMDDFYEDTNEKERNHFLDFAVKLAKSDNEIPEEENIFLEKLFNSWAPEFEEEN